MDYLATYPYAYIRYHDSDMQLHIYKETADHVFPKAQTIIRGFYRLTNTPHTNDRFYRNGAIFVEWKTLRYAVASAVEAEVGRFFYNAQMEIPIRNTLESLGHLKKPTPIRTDNSIATVFVYDNIHTERSKYWVMQYYWLQDCTTQE